ncbi:MAG TPA: hypothetical protein VNX88_03450 [Terriglobales bacterium]|jgi:hypothetical protein|nr:hypothetical protein [Terriglobales bacterium]
MKRFAMNLTAYVLIALGLLVSTQHAYLYGLAKGKLETASSTDALRIHSLQNLSVTGFAGGILILVIGQVLLYRNVRKVHPDPGREAKSVDS